MGGFSTTTAQQVALSSVADFSSFLVSALLPIVTMIVALLALGMALKYVARVISGPSFGGYYPTQTEANYMDGSYKRFRDSEGF